MDLIHRRNAKVELPRSFRRKNFRVKKSSKSNLRKNLKSNKKLLREPVDPSSLDSDERYRFRWAELLRQRSSEQKNLGEGGFKIPRFVMLVSWFSLLTRDKKQGRKKKRVRYLFKERYELKPRVFIFEGKNLEKLFGDLIPSWNNFDIFDEATNNTFDIHIKHIEFVNFAEMEQVEVEVKTIKNLQITN